MRFLCEPVAVRCETVLFLYLLPLRDEMSLEFSEKAEEDAPQSEYPSFKTDKA